MRIDLRTRCRRCGKLKPLARGPITRMRADDFERYTPFCSYHCQEWHAIEQAQRWLEYRKRDES